MQWSYTGTLGLLLLYVLQYQLFSASCLLSHRDPWYAARNISPSFNNNPKQGTSRVFDKDKEETNVNQSDVDDQPHCHKADQSLD